MKLGTFRQKAIALIASCLVTFTATAHAADNCNPCKKNWMEMCGDINVGVDFLLWKACANDLDYGVVFDGNPQPPFLPVVNAVNVPGSYQYVNPTWEPGFRVHIGKDNIWCGWDIDAAYTRYTANKTHASTVGAGQFGYDSLFHGGFNGVTDISSLEGKYGIRYQTLDFLVGYKWCINPCSVIHPFFGVEGLKLNQEIHTLSQNAALETQAVDWTSDYRGIGLKAGTDYHYTFCDGLSLFSLASVSLLAGNNDQSSHQVLTIGTNPDTADQTYISNDCFCMPGLHLQVGLEYAQNFCDKEMSLRIGYEFLDWWNAARPRRFFNGGDDIALSTRTAGSNITLHGLFVGLDVGF